MAVKVVVRPIAKLSEGSAALGLTPYRFNPCQASVSSTLIGRFRGRAIRDVSHQPSAGLPPRRHRWASWWAYESPVVRQLIRFQV